MRCLYALTAVLTLSSGMYAQPYDTVVAGNNETCHGFELIAFHALEWTGGLYTSTSGPDVAAIAPAPGGRVFGAVVALTTFTVMEIRPDGSRLPVSVAASGYPIAMVVDRAGAIYVLTTRNWDEVSLVAFSSDGTLRAEYPLQRDHTYAPGLWGRTAIDLAADQCTLFIPRARQFIDRFNVCTGTYLAGFATTSLDAAALRVLPDGGLIVAGGGSVYRLDPSGVFLRYYAHDHAQALMLTDGGNRLTYGYQTDDCRGRLVTVDLNRGAVLGTTNLRMEYPTSIVSYFGWTAALGAAHIAAVPASGTLALVALALGLVTAAVVRLG